MVPKVIVPYLWYLDIAKVDLERDKKRIILNVLNFGTKEATDWLFSYYSREDIKNVLVNHGGVGELSKKSLNFWCVILDVSKKELITSRF